MSLPLRVVKFVGEVAYRRSPPWDTEEPAPELVELIEGRTALPPGRALDLGCGTGTNSAYLAGRGWDVTGVDIVRNAIAAARRRADAAGVKVHFVEGDVTELHRSGLGGGYTLITDFGCFHGLPAARRDSYAAGVTAAGAPGAVLLMLGMGRGAGVGIDPDELPRRFPAWRLRRATRLATGEFFARFRPSLFFRILARTRIPVWRFELEFTGNLQNPGS